MGVVTSERQEGEAHVRGRDAPRRPCSSCIPQGPRHPLPVFTLLTRLWFSRFSFGPRDAQSPQEAQLVQDDKRTRARSTPGELATGAPFFLGKK